MKIISGKDRGKTGSVLSVNRDSGRIVVKGINTFKKRMKPTRERQKGEVVVVERSLAASNAMIGCKREARRCVRLARETYPDFSIERWLAMVPNKRPEYTQRYADGLRMAGFQ